MPIHESTPELKESTSWLVYFQYLIYGSVILYFGRDILVPLSFALLISFVLYPSCAWMERKGVGRMTAIIIHVVILIAAAAIVFMVLVQQVVLFMDEWPSVQEKFLDMLSDLSGTLASGLGISPEQQALFVSSLGKQAAESTWTIITRAISFSTVSAVFLILVPVYAVLILYYRHHWVNVLYRLVPSERTEDTHALLLLTVKTYFNFIKGMGIVYLAVGILNSIGLWILGIPHPFLFGFIASVLTFIPYVGIMAGSLLPIAMAWTTYDSIWYPVGVVGVFTVVQYLEANIIFPFAVSKRLKVNTLVVLIAIFAGGLLWGVAGMILFVPFIGIAKLIADHNPHMKTLSMILGVREVDK